MNQPVTWARKDTEPLYASTAAKRADSVSQQLPGGTLRGWGTEDGQAVGRATGQRSPQGRRGVGVKGQVRLGEERGAE